MRYGQRPLAPANFERRELYADQPTWKTFAFGLTHDLLVRMGATDAEICSGLRRVRLRCLWEG